MDNLVDVIKETFLDSLHLLPFLIVTYLVMEAVERAAAGRTANMLAKAGPFGPFIGALFGAFPQCGFSAAASNFYSAGLIGMGTAIAVFMSTSDEMLPIFIAEQAAPATIVKILIAKVIIGAVSGYIIAILGKKFFGKQKAELDKHREEHGHDCSEEGRALVPEALLRTLKTFGFVLVITFILNLVIELLGDGFLESILKDTPVIGQAMAGIVGLIPNCASSIAISKLYLSGVISAGTMMSGLLVSAGVGLLVLFEENHNVKENIIILSILYFTSLIWGILIEMIGITF